MSIISSNINRFYMTLDLYVLEFFIKAVFPVGFYSTGGQVLVVAVLLLSI